MNRARRRILVYGMAGAMPQTLWAQLKTTQVVIGWLASTSKEIQAPEFAAFKQGLAELGWKESPKFLIEERWANGDYAALDSLAREIQAKQPAVIVTRGGQATAAAAKAAPGTAIVMAGVDNPLAAGFVKTLAQPGGMITGLSNFGAETSEKSLELLLAAQPNTKRVGYLINPTNMNHQAQLSGAKRSAAHYGIDARFESAVRREDIDPALSRLANEGIQGLIVLVSSLFNNEQRRIATAALVRKWPVVAATPGFAEAGALIAHYSDRLVFTRRAAFYVDRILKGTKPSELPVEQPTTFEITLNLTTAKALNLAISPELMVRVNRVVE